MAAKEDTSTAAKDPAPEQTTDAVELGMARRRFRRGLPDWRLLVLAALVIAALALAGGVYYFQYRPDQQTDAAAADAAKQAADDGSVALLSYAPDSLDKDIANAQSYLTGDFLKYYTDFTQQIATSAAKERQAQSTAGVVRAAVAELHPDSAVVLVFVNKQSWSKEKPEPVMTQATVRVTMAKVDGSWLISKFEPI
jgi:Mce-associated membrane protein